MIAEIKQKMLEALKRLGVEKNVEDIALDKPVDPSHGDWASNIALQLASELGQSPRQIAENIVAQIEVDQWDDVEVIEIAGPGFINFKLSEKYFLGQLVALKMNDSGTGKRVMVEFTDPNPFKEFHIGHLYSNVVGESLSRIFEAVGWDVHRACYQGDVGMHVAKSVWGVFEQLTTDGATDALAMTLKLDEISLWASADRQKYLGKSYSLGASAYEEDKGVQKSIKALNALLYAISQDRLVEEKSWEPIIDYWKFVPEHDYDIDIVKKIYTFGRAWSLDYFESIYKRLGTKFDSYFFESLSAEYGTKWVEEHIADGVFEVSNGATIFKGEKVGKHTRVFINSTGLPTYEAKDLGLAPLKYEVWPYDYSVIVTGAEIDSYFQVVLAAMNEINPEIGQKTRHVSHGMVKLPEGKMSSRTGKILRGEWLLDEAKQVVLDRYEAETNKPNDYEEIAEEVGKAAIKFSLLKANVGRDISFDFDESISISGNSGPYIQYTYSRCLSLINKDTGVDHYAYDFGGTELSMDENELELIKLLIDFPVQVNRAAEQLAPNYICAYLFELSQKFNNFYNNNPILKAESEEAKDFRMGLVAKTSVALHDGLHLLGINVVEHM